MQDGAGNGDALALPTREEHAALASQRVGRILHCANILIDNNEHVFDKKLFSNLGEGEKLQIIEAKNEEHEAERVVGELIVHCFTHKTQYKDYAMLYRGNHQSRLLEKVLMQNRIPYKISGGTSFFS